MKRFAATVPVLLVVLLVFASAAATQRAPRVARIGMLCLSSCAPAPVTNAQSDELRKLGWVEGPALRPSKSIITAWGHWPAGSLAPG